MREGGGEAAPADPDERCSALLGRRWGQHTRRSLTLTRPSLPFSVSKPQAPLPARLRQTTASTAGGGICQWSGSRPTHTLKTES